MESEMEDGEAELTTKPARFCPPRERRRAETLARRPPTVGARAVRRPTRRPSTREGGKEGEEERVSSREERKKRRRRGDDDEPARRRGPRRGRAPS